MSGHSGCSTILLSALGDQRIDDMSRLAMGDQGNRFRELSECGRGMAPWHTRSCVVGKPVIVDEYDGSMTSTWPVLAIP